MAAHKFNDRLVAEPAAVQQLELLRAHRPSRRAKGKNIVERRRHLHHPLIAVAHDTGEPFGIGSPAANHPRDLGLQPTNLGRFRPRMVIVVEGGQMTAGSLHRRSQATLELVIVVAVEQIMLAIILIMNNGLNPSQQPVELFGLESGRGGAAIGIGGIGGAAPGTVGRGEVAATLPLARIDERLQPRAIASRLRAKNPIPCQPPRRACRHAAGLNQLRFGSQTGGAQGILGGGFRQFGDGHGRAIDEGDGLGEGVAEQA